MAIAKMSVAELEKFLHEEFPQAFSNADIAIESADGETCASATTKECCGRAERCRGRR
jgi:hypothetical protein